LGVNHWLLALIERHGAMAERLTTGLNAAALRGCLYQKLQQGAVGAPLSMEDVQNRATAARRNAARHRPPSASSRR
jgi:hypothetical protein